MTIHQQKELRTKGMKSLFVSLTFIALSTEFSPALAAVPAQSLKDAYVATIQRSETLQIQNELLRQSQEQSNQSLGAMLPTIAGSANWTQQHTNQSVSEQDSKKLTFTQPLFRGLKDFATLRQKKALFESQAYAVKVAAKQLFFDLTQAYYNVLAYGADQKNAEIEIQLNKKRIQDLEHFLRIGRSKDTDLLTFRSNQASVEAQLESTKGQLETAKDVLAFLTGWNRETPLTDSEALPSEQSVDQHLTRLESRPDVLAAVRTAQASGEALSGSWGGHLPSLDLLGNYYFQTPGQVQGQPTSQNDWDVQLALTVPLFQGGVVQSQIREARSILTQAELQLSATRKLAEEEIRTLFNSANAEKKQVAKLEETVLWAKKSYDAETRDYRNGLVTNIDVLQAMTTYQDSQRTLDHARYQWKIDSVKLEAATGQRPEIDVPVASNRGRE